MAEFAELGMTAVNHLTEKHGDATYDRVQAYNPLSSRYKQSPSQKKQDDNDAIIDDQQSTRSGRRSRERPHNRHTAELPSPERERNDYYQRPPPAVVNDREYDRQSETSERVLRNYENERDDPRRSPDPSQDRYAARDMSYNHDDRRLSSQGRPRSRSRYDDDGGSDYDERTGQRYRASGRGYDDRHDRDYDREIIETEVYRGPPRDWGAQRSASYQGADSEYAVTQYRGGSGELAPYDSKQRSRSRGRRDRDRDDYSDRSRSRDRDREREREHEGIRGKLDNAFDTSGRGIGAGLLGAVVGGLAGRQFGDKKHSKRDMVIGAVVGGLAVNAAENKWRERKEERDEEKLGGRKYEDRYDSRYDDREYRSRSAMR